MSKPTQARYRWLLSQMRWHEKTALAVDEGPRWKWHARQTIYYERQIMRMWDLK